LDRLQTMRTFASVAETGSFSETARLLGVSAAKVSREVGDLEAHLGIRLFDRTTRRVGLSEAGGAYYPECIALLERIDAVEARVAGRGARPVGLLRVSVPMDFGRLFLGPAFREFLSRAPEVRLDVRYDDREARLLEEQVDVAVRIGRLADSSLVARRLGSACLGCYASPDYLAQAGAPEAPGDLAQHQLLAYSLADRPHHWPFDENGRKTEISLAGRSRLTGNNGRALAEAACRGLGIVRLPEFLVQDHVERGALIEVLEPFRSPPLDISAITLHRRFRPAKIEGFIEFLVGYFDRRRDWTPAGF
jgi:DNA-binding transcriptional LysR family regulator